MLLGLGTRRGAAVAAEDFGLHGKTAADGLAVGRPSELVCQAMAELLDGAFTVRDEALFHLLALLARTEDIRLEPSALAGFAGLDCVARHEREAGLAPSAAHIVWATGGNMVPEAEWLGYRAQAERLAEEK
jgi:D-serine dehydratase